MDWKNKQTEFEKVAHGNLVPWGGWIETQKILGPEGLTDWEQHKKIEKLKNLNWERMKIDTGLGLDCNCLEMGKKWMLHFKGRKLGQIFEGLRNE